jgi:ABC-type lipoprotein export system ATPase subunit
LGYVGFKEVSKYYHVGETLITAADHMSFSIEGGEFCVIVGPSGAGKTTLLNMLGGMDSCDSGIITLDGREISALNERRLTDYRRHEVGFVFQFYNLIPNLTALENVELASEICLNPREPAETLRAVGLAERMNNFPAQLSGGEQQRVAIARALAKTQDTPLRRTHRRPGLRHGKTDPQTPPGKLPGNREDGDPHHPQPRHRLHGGPGHPGKKRPDPRQRNQRPSPGGGTY